MNKLNRTLLILMPLCLLCGLLISIAYDGLHPRIEAQQHKTEAAIYFEALQLPADTAQLDSTHATSNTTLLGLRTLQSIYIARQNHRVVGVVLPLTARDGYGGDIDLLLGIDTGGKVISVRVVSEHETRDLGDKIERHRSDRKNSDWLDQFNHATFEEAQKNRWQTREQGGDFDGITGATVTSHAVIQSVQQGLEYFSLHRAELLDGVNRH